MRLRITFDSDEEIFLDFNYQYKLTGVVYRLLEKGNEHLAESYHMSSNFKLFTFSWLESKRRKIYSNKINLKPPITWYISSINREFIEAIISGLLNKKIIKLSGNFLIPVELKVLRDINMNRRMKFYTISPILVRGYKPNKQNKHIDLSPKESQFYENLQKNLIKKYEYFFKKSLSDRSFNIKRIYSPVSKRIKVKNEFYRAWNFGFEVEGNPRLLEVGYECGFGEKNSMGFGMVKTMRR